jgi:hypothetical protein
MRNGYKILVVRPEGKRELEGPRLRAEYNIEMELTEIG